MAQAPAKKRPSAPVRAAAKRTTAKPVEPWEIVSPVDGDGNFVAKVFGEPFTFSADVNGMLILFAGSGRSSDVVALIESVLVVEPVEGEDIEVTRLNVRNRFVRHVGAQRGFSVEDAIELINEMTSAAGNES